MSNSRVSMHSANTNTKPYVKFDGLVNYKPTKGEFSVYFTETKESSIVKTISGALITRRNVVLATSIGDKPVSSEDFDGFNELLTFRENIKGGKVIAKDMLYSDAKAKADSLFLSNSFRLATCLYLVTKKGGVLKLNITGTTRMKINEALDNMGDIDFINISVDEKTITVGAGSRSQEVHELIITEEKKDYSRVAMDKINGTVNTLKSILEYKKTGVVSGVTTEEALDTFADVNVNDTTADDLPI